jgi:transposase
MSLLTLHPTERGQLHHIALHAPSGRECCRAQALLWLADGDAPEDIADHLGVTRRTLYNWVHRFQQRDGSDILARLQDGTRSGRPPTALGLIDPVIAAVIDDDPRPHGYHATVWTAPLLQHYLRDAHGLDVSRKSVGRAIDRLGYRWKRPRYVLANRSQTWRQAKGG